MSEDAFVEAVTEGQGVAPLYFAFAADANRRERDLLDDTEAPPTLTLDEAIAAHEAGAVLLDTRAPETFASGHLRGAMNVGLDGRFAEYAGDIIRPGQQVVLLSEPGRGTEARVRLARIGFDDVIGEVPDIEAALAAQPEHATTAPRLPVRRGPGLARGGAGRAGARRPQPRRGRRSAPSLVRWSSPSPSC